MNFTFIQRINMKVKVGIDIGSTTVKVVVLDENDKSLYESYERHFAKVREKAVEQLKAASEFLKGNEIKVSITGSAGLGGAKAADIPFVQEVYATARAVNKYIPQADAVIELGGEDAKILFLTNASGGINPQFGAGSFMLITDHISCFAPNPLVGPNEEELGCRFPDMSAVYDKDLQDTIRKTAKACDIPLKEGIYVQLTGPSFESPAEIKMLRTLGADAVGMSTVVEAIAANHMGMKICGISCVANLAAGMTDNPLTHEEVQEAANKAAPLFCRLVTESITAF